YTLDFYTEKPIERVRALWLGGRFSIRGRPWSEEFDRPTGDAVEIGPYEDMHIHRAGKNGDTLRIYQRPKKGSQLGWPEAVWGELTISDDGFARLNESLTAPVTIDQSIKADPLEAYKQ